MEIVEEQAGFWRWGGTDRYSET